MNAYARQIVPLFCLLSFVSCGHTKRIPDSLSRQERLSYERKIALLQREMTDLSSQNTALLADLERRKRQSVSVNMSSEKLTQNHGADPKGREHYLHTEAERFFQLKKWEEFDEISGEFLREFESSELTQEVLWMVGHSWLDRGSPLRALEVFNRLIHRFPRGQRIPGVLLSKAKAYQRLRLFDQAELVFRQIHGAYPKTSEAQSALGELKIMAEAGEKRIRK